MKDAEAKEFLSNTVVAPDDLVINGHNYKLEGTYLTRSEAIGSKEMNRFPSKIFKYVNGYALYEYRGY